MPDTTFSTMVVQSEQAWFFECRIYKLARDAAMVARDILAAFVIESRAIRMSVSIKSPPWRSSGR